MKKCLIVLELWWYHLNSILKVCMCLGEWKFATRTGGPSWHLLDGEILIILCKVYSMWLLVIFVIIKNLCVSSSSVTKTFTQIDEVWMNNKTSIFKKYYSKRPHWYLAPRNTPLTLKTPIPCYHEFAKHFWKFFAVTVFSCTVMLEMCAASMYRTNSKHLPCMATLTMGKL